MAQRRGSALRQQRRQHDAFAHPPLPTQAAPSAISEAPIADASPGDILSDTTDVDSTNIGRGGPARPDRRGPRCVPLGLLSWRRTAHAPRDPYTDRDDMPDGWEVTHGLTPLVANAFDDDDGDRYPNVFEHTYSTDPSNRVSIPTPTYLVNGAGGGTHTTVGAALSAANVANGAYQIIGIAPGVYTGAANLRSGVTISSTKPKLLLIGLQGAAKTMGADPSQRQSFQRFGSIGRGTKRSLRARYALSNPIPARGP